MEPTGGKGVAMSRLKEGSLKGRLKMGIYFSAAESHTQNFSLCILFSPLSKGVSG